MPANLFDPDLRPAPAGAARRLTVTTSIVIHAAAVLLVVVLPLIGGVSLPAAIDRIDAFAAPLPAPAPPPVQAPAAPQTVTAPNPNAAPLHAPDSIPLVESVVTAGTPNAPPGSLPMSGGYGVPGGIPGVAPTTLEAPPPKKQEPVRAGGMVTPPARVSYAAPVYPKIAESARIEGTVILEAIISETGVVTNVKVLKSIPLLDDAAKQAVSQWRYSPTTLNGVKVPVIMTVTVTFSLK